LSDAPWLERLTAGFRKTSDRLGDNLTGLFTKATLDPQTLDEIEEALIASDLGPAAAARVRARLASERFERGLSEAAVREIVAQELAKILEPVAKPLEISAFPRPQVILVVGVNGSGKTTTVGKIARVLVAQGCDVVLGAADTFRAAAADQLQTWGERVGVHTVRGPEGSDPASVAFEAVKAGVEREADTVIVDTAGRLHTKTGLMDELGKVKRVVEKQAPVSEVLLVLDATTGQNGMMQARVFSEVVDVSGIVLTKLDGTAKGGIVVAVQRELGVPVKLVGLGEGADDLAPFEAEAFVDALLGESSLA
jgi:fused signal recognition particle receptor